MIVYGWSLYLKNFSYDVEGVAFYLLQIQCWHRF